MKPFLFLPCLIVGLLLVGASTTLAVEQKAIDEAVKKGVSGLRHLQGDDGTWPGPHIGATALAGLALLECGASPDDRAVQKAADAVRNEAVALTHTYSLALAVLFFDRLGDPGDVPLIESMTVRLLAGQASNGGWSYTCPAISAAEARRLTALLAQRRELVGRRELPAKGNSPKRTVKDLPHEIQDQLKLLNRNRPEEHGGDNSNTQFATLALWVARRHGLPVEQALTRLDKRFRASQNADGGWGYHSSPSRAHPLGGTTATMTCAGLLALAVAHGSAVEQARDKAPGAKLLVRDLSQDRAIRNGLIALGSQIDHPQGKRKGKGLGTRGMDMLAVGRVFYLLWSLERVAVCLDLATIGDKDWYGWGAEIALASQLPDGSWRGAHADCGADTCFTLLFLRRSNLAQDLTSNLRGKLKDPGEHTLKAGGLPSDLPAVKPSATKAQETTPAAKTSEQPKPKVEAPTPAAKNSDPPAPPRPVAPVLPERQRLADGLVTAPAEGRERLVEDLRSGKGTVYTEALALAIPRLEGETRQKARAALADRLTRMKAVVLIAYLQDEDAEIRRAAALACAMKDSKTFVVNLIPLLADREAFVVRASHVALKELTGKDLPPDRAAWQAWWDKEGKAQARP